MESACTVEEGDGRPKAFDRANWFRGLDLTERLAVLRGEGTSSRHDPELAERRLRHWRSVPGLEDDALWRRRLAAVSVSEEELRIVAGEPPETLARRFHGGERRPDPPAWLDEIRRVYTVADAEPFPWPDPDSARERCPFLPLTEPLVRVACERLERGARELVEDASEEARPPARLQARPSVQLGPVLFEPERAVRALLASLPEHLALPLNRLLVVEMHAARLEGRLPGDTPEARFEEFRRGLYRREVALDILAEYPVFTRSLVIRIRQWEETGLELLRHLAADGPELRRRFTGAETRDAAPGLLVAARGGLSDPHHGGRTVFILRFESGLRLVYKPRSLRVEKVFQDLLAWLGDQGFSPSARVVEVFDAGDHGWMEHVEAASCDSVEEARRFFLRQGAYLALLHLLDGTDVHHENLIAAGEHPVLLDLETLFHPPVDGPSLRDVDRHPGAPLRDSVLASGLLPQRVWGGRERAGVDISGLGARPGQQTPGPVLAPTGHQTDDMRFERRVVEIPLGENRPRLAGREVSVIDNGEEVEEGFERMFRFLTGHRDELAAEDGPLAAFAGAPVRIIFRPTAGYGSLLVETCHPHVAGNALERHRLFDRLWGGVPDRPFLETLIPHEQEELARGDIPRFLTRPDSRDVWTGTGERLLQVFEDTGLERVRRRLSRWTESDLVRQRSVIRGALDALRLETSSPERPSYDFREGVRPATRRRLLDAAARVAERLLDLAFEGPEEALWLVVDHGEPEGWRLDPTRPDFYRGAPGIALFLGFLGELTGDGECRRTAHLALRSQALQIEREPERVQGLGLLNGWGGVLYALTHLGVLWGDEELLDEAESHLERLPDPIAEDEILDLGAGSAGCLLSLLVLAEHRPSDLLRRLALQCGERLLATAAPQRRGLGWVTPLAGNRVLAGISHGAAGIALSLLRLAAASGDERFLEAARGGIELERSLFSPEERNWPDLRAWSPGDADAPDPTDVPDPVNAVEIGPGRFMCAWCHGAPGVGLARLAGLPQLDDAAVRDEIAVAVETTLEQGFGDNHSLCHGDLGNLDFLLSAARALDDRKLLETVYRRAAGVLDDIEEHGWRFGLPGNVETPGLMVGLAGIGYGLARLAEPDRLPALLAFEGPICDRPRTPS